MRAAVYVRLSELVEGTTSPDRQRADCAKIIEANGWQHDPDLDVYEDLDVSAYSGATRPSWDRLLASLDSYDVLVCWKLDRLYRRFTGFVRLMETLDAHSVRLVSVNDTLDTTTPIGQAVAGFLAAQAETESANASVRIRSAMDHLARTGRWHGGKVPYGWHPVERPDGGRRLAIDPATAPTVRQIVAWLEQGMSGRAVANRLNETGVPSWSGRPWSGQQIYKIVRNPRMAGWQPTNGNNILRDPDGHPIPGPEPMIDTQRWERLVARLANVGWDRTRRAGATLLSGLGRCGLCHGPLAGWISDHPRASYACSRKADSGRAYCPGLSIKRDWLDTYVADAVVAAVERYRTRIPQAPRERETPADPVAPLVAQLRRLERDRTELGLYDDPESEQVYVARWRELRRQIGEARRATTAAAERAARPSVDDVAPDDIRTAWPALEVDEQRAVIRAMVEYVEVGPVREGMRGKWDPKRVHIEWLPV